jgi:VRR-NUC domain
MYSMLALQGKRMTTPEELFAKSEFSAREYKETRLQMAICNYLKGVIRQGNKTTSIQAPFPGLVWTYTGGEGKDDNDRLWNYLKGRRSGVPDYFSWYAGVPSQAIETKTVDGKLEPKQKDFLRDFEAAGGVTCIPRSVAAVRDFYIGLGIPCKNTHCIEPKLSHSELMSLQRELYKR